MDPLWKEVGILRGSGRSRAVRSELHGRGDLHGRCFAWMGKCTGVSAGFGQCDGGTIHLGDVCVSDLGTIRSVESDLGRGCARPAKLAMWDIVADDPPGLGRGTGY